MYAFGNLTARKRIGLVIFGLGFFFVFAIVLARAKPQHEFLCRESDVLKDSEVGYLVKHTGFVLGKGGRRLFLQHYAVIAKNGKCYAERRKTWDAGFVTKKRKRISPKKYMELWKRLEALGIWSKESRTPDTVGEKIKGKTQEEALKIYFEEYERDIELDQDSISFKIRVGNRKHHFGTYDTEALRDKTYKKILDEISKLF